MWLNVASKSLILYLHGSAIKRMTNWNIKNVAICKTMLFSCIYVAS